MNVNSFFIISGIIITVKSVCIGMVSGLGNEVRRNTSFGKKHNCGQQQCFCDGQTAHCIGDKMMTTLPKFRRRVTELYAECYDLSNLDRDSLRNINGLGLDKIHLRRNDIQNISMDVFSDFQHLTLVEVSGNVNLDQQLLFPALRSLNKTGIVSLFLQENRMNNVNFTVLEEFTNIRNLTLSSNRIKSIKRMGAMNSLEELNLAMNKLKLKKGLQFCMQGHLNSSRFPNLKKLHLGRNKLGYGRDALHFAWRCLDKLEYLDMSNNTIKEVNLTLFESLPSLQNLNLASNWIQRINVGLYPPRLEKLNFFDNHFAGLLPNLCYKIRNKKTFPNLKHLFFGRNYLQRLDTRWNCLPGIETLDFYKNDVRYISNNTFSNFKNLKTLQLNNMIPWDKKFEPRAFYSASLQNLDIRFNWIDFSKPQNRYIFGFSPNVTRLDISYNNFTGMSVESLKNIIAPMRKLETLIMQRVSLRTFPVEILQNLTNLKVLNIDQNQLHSLEFPPSFNDTSKKLKIQNISIAKCFINTIKENAFPLILRKSLKYLDLSENQFLCDCDMEWFRDKVNSAGFIDNIKLLNWPENYKCASPTSLSGHKFKDFKPNEICKPLNPIIIALITIGSFLVVFVFLASVIYWNRWYLRYWWYKISKRKRGVNKSDPELQPILNQIHFDGYVVSNDNDNDFVHHPFRELIEERLGFRCHIWERDANNGSLVDVMLDAMYASKHIIVVVSNNLINDAWCKFQVDVAIDRNIELGQNCVILVVLDDVDFKPVSKSWCVLLTKTPTAHWSNDKDSIKQKLFEETIKMHLGEPLKK